MNPPGVAAGADPTVGELDEAREQLAATGEILRVIASSRSDPQPVFDIIASSAAHLCHAKFSFVYRFDGTLLHFVAHHGLSPKALAKAQASFPMAPGRGTAGARAMLSGKVEQIPNLHADPEYTSGAILGRDSRSTVAVPILHEGIPIGAIAIDRAEAGVLPERQVKLLEAFRKPSRHSDRKRPSVQRGGSASSRGHRGAGAADRD